MIVLFSTMQITIFPLKGSWVYPKTTVRVSVKYNIRDAYGCLLLFIITITIWERKRIRIDWYNIYPNNIGTYIIFYHHYYYYYYSLSRPISMINYIYYIVGKYIIYIYVSRPLPNGLSFIHVKMTVSVLGAPAGWPARLHCARNTRLSGSFAEKESGLVHTHTHNHPHTQYTHNGANPGRGRLELVAIYHG